VAVYGQVSVGLTASGFVNKIDVIHITTPGITGWSVGGITPKASFSVGGFIQADHTSWLSTRLEVNYTNTGFSSTVDGRGGPDFIANKNTFHYAQFSPMVGVRVKRGFSLFAGPTLNAHTGSSTRAQSATRDSQGLLIPTGQWSNREKSFLEENGPSFGSVEPFVLGWQVQLGYTYKRFSVHARRQWQTQPMGNVAFSGVANSNNLFYFRSWQYGLSYALFQSRSK